MKIATAAHALAIGLIVLATFASVASSRLYSQEQQTSQRSETQTGAQEPGRTAKATRVERAPELDGTLDDPEWQSATPISGFLQREPFEGQAPTARTEVRIFYDKHDVYFGIVCFDSDPSKIVARELRRDALKSWTTISKSSSTPPMIAEMHTSSRSTRWAHSAMR